MLLIFKQISFYYIELTLIIYFLLKILSTTYYSKKERFLRKVNKKGTTTKKIGKTSYYSYFNH